MAGAPQTTATESFNNEQCQLSTRDDLKCLCNAHRLVPPAWLQLSFYHLPSTLTKQPHESSLILAKEAASNKLGKIQDGRQKNGNL